MKMIYLHGFNSSGDSDTVRNLKSVLPDLTAITYDSTNPIVAFHQIDTVLQATMKEDADIVLIGTSLGGFWAHYFSQKYNFKSVLNNPSLTPWESLLKYVGKVKNFATGEERVLTKEAVKNYKQYDVEVKPDYFRYVILGIKDEVLDYRIAESKFRGKSKIIYTNEGHRISNYSDFAKMIIEASNYYPEAKGE